MKNQDDPRKMAMQIVANFRRLRQRSFWKKFISGGVSVIEITGSSGDWHVHIHVLMASKYIPQAYLLQHWREISGKAGVFIKTASKQQIIAYLTKYLTSTSDESIDKTASDALRGFRLFQPFGQWHNALPPYIAHPRPCEKCGASVFYPEEAYIYGWKSVFNRSPG